MNKTKQLKIFDDEYFPVGSCIRVTMNPGMGYEELTIDCLIARYESMHTVMLVLYIDPVTNQHEYKKLTVDELDSRYLLEKLVPEKVVE